MTRETYASISSRAAVTVSAGRTAILFIVIFVLGAKVNLDPAEQNGNNENPTEKSTTNDKHAGDTKEHIEKKSHMNSPIL